MRPRLLVLFLLVVALPLAVLGGLGAKLVRHDREMVRVRFQEVLVERLRDADRAIADVITQRERILLSLTDLGGLTPAALRERARDSATVQQFFVLDATGELIYPDPGSSELTSQEWEFLRRTEAVWSDGKLLRPAVEGKAAGKTVASGRWHTWFWGNGLHLMYAWRDNAGRICGAELNRARLMADVIAALPSGDPGSSAEASRRITLQDSRGAVLYQWGAFEPEAASAMAELSVSAPLSAWRLGYYAPETAPGAGAWLNLAALISGLAVVFIGLAVYFYRESSRDLREAAQRVSFVNQVSHELKTPLTNIRMYAELLEESLAEEEGDARRHLGIIGSESRRLSRLIGNVLTFGRRERSALRLHPTPGVIDDVVADVLGHTASALVERGVTLDVEQDAGHESEFDRDVLEQILGNLISNVEKYATDAHRLGITTRQEGENVTITVQDDGPGIPARDAARVFEPFYRVSNKLNDGVAGTGIGLSIARDLARLHGGDLTLEPSESGARFKLVIRAPLSRSEERT
jgi:signal transduction histidine kinase